MTQAIGRKVGGTAGITKPGLHGYIERCMWVDCGSESHAEWILLKSKELTQHCSPLYTKVLVDSGVRHWGHGHGNTARGSCRKLPMIPLLIMMLWETWEEGNSSRPNYSIKYFGKATDYMKGKRRQTTKWPLLFDSQDIFFLLLCWPVNVIKPALLSMCSKILSMVCTVIHSGGCR